MKNILKYILCFAVCVGAFFATATTAYAESDEPIMCGEAFNVGDRIYYYGRVYSYDDMYLLYDEPATQSTYRVCIYLIDGNSSSGKVFQVLNNMIVGNVYKTEDNSLLHTGHGLQGYVPQEYKYKGSGTSIDFRTNIPIFENKADAVTYYNTGEGLNKAINYKKVFENGSWVKPFEDIEINDSNMSSPQLANVSHSGFTCINIPDDRYMVDVYLESGIQQPYNYQQGLKDTGTGFFVNSFGLISDQDGAYTGQIDLLECYGVDNVSALTQSCVDFYTNYPSVKAFNSANYPNGLGGLENNSKTFAIWGQPFARNFVLWTINSSVSSSEISAIDVYNIPIAYTNYKVRYFYYDDDTGFHYGPWTNFVYFSDGRVLQGTVFQGNDGSVIETPLDKGSQDSSGNVSINTTVGNIVDLNNPNELFGYIRTVINNVNATGNSFMSLFASVFSFLPGDMLAALWLGVACMILIGLIKALWG